MALESIVGLLVAMLIVQIGILFILGNIACYVTDIKRMLHK